MNKAEYAWTYQTEDWHWWFVSRRRIADTLLKRNISTQPDQLILDLGCGTGGNLKFLTRWGKVVGMDVSSLALNLAQNREISRLVQGSGLTLPYPGSTFSLVTAFDMLYHLWVSDDVQVLKECCRVLQPGGWLLMTIPALPDLWSPHDEVYHTRQRYRLNEVRQKLTETGFHPHLCSYTYLLFLPFFTIIRLASRWLRSLDRFDQRLLPCWINRRLIGMQNLETVWFRRGGTLPLGSSLICLAQKR